MLYILMSYKNYKQVALRMYVYFLQPGLTYTKKQKNICWALIPFEDLISVGGRVRQFDVRLQYSGGFDQQAISDSVLSNNSPCRSVQNLFVPKDTPDTQKVFMQYNFDQVSYCSALAVSI